MQDATAIVEFFEFAGTLYDEKRELETLITETEDLVENLEALAMVEAASALADRLRIYRDELSLVEADLAVATV